MKKEVSYFVLVKKKFTKFDNAVSGGIKYYFFSISFPSTVRPSSAKKKKKRRRGEIGERDLFTSPIFFGDFVSIERAS